MFEVNNFNKHTEKWKLDIVEWLENNCSEHFNSKIVIPCNYHKGDYCNWVSVLEVDLGKEYLSTDKQIKSYIRLKNVNLQDVPHISLSFKDSVKRVHHTFKDYMINRIWGDFELKFSKDEIPFYYTSNISHMRFYNPEMLNNKGERLDIEEVN